MGCRLRAELSACMAGGGGRGKRAVRTGGPQSSKQGDSGGKAERNHTRIRT